MRCLCCGETISPERLEALPNTKTCANCSSVVRVVGFMSWEHKTAPSLVVLDGSNKEVLRLARRANRRAR